MRGLGTVGLRHVARCRPARRAALLVQSERVEGLAVRGLWLRAVVEDPDDLENVLVDETLVDQYVSAYRHH